MSTYNVPYCFIGRFSFRSYGNAEYGNRPKIYKNAHTIESFQLFDSIASEGGNF